jgi:hypothetical protein
MLLSLAVFRGLLAWLGREATTWSTVLPLLAALGGPDGAWDLPCPVLLCPSPLPLDRWPWLQSPDRSGLWLAHSATAPAGGGTQ